MKNGLLSYLLVGQIEVRNTTLQEPMWKALQGCPSEGQE